MKIKVTPIDQNTANLEPLDPNCIYEIEESELAYISNNLKQWHKKEDNTWEIITVGSQEEIEAYEKNCLRGKRSKLLRAWDILLSNYSFGAIKITAEEKASLISWKQQILDLNVAAINNPPEPIKKYL